MKYRTTRKAIVNGSAHMISIGYCDAASLLINHQPIAYTAGVYGWNFDVYEIDGVTICTGYRGMPGRCAYDVREWDRKARAILDDYNRPFEERRAEVENLLHEYLAQV